MNEQQEAKVRKDMAEDYANKLGQILTEIDQCKKWMINNPIIALNLNERLHALYIKLSSKMNSEEIAEQKRYRDELDNARLVKYKPNPYNYKERVKIVNHENFNAYKNLLEDREIALNKAMERMGLTVQEIHKKVRVT